MSRLKCILLVVGMMAAMNSCLAQVDSTVLPESTRNETAKPPVRAPKKKNTDTIQLNQTGEAAEQDSVGSHVVNEDTLPVKDTVQHIAAPIIAKIDTGTYRKYETHPWLPLQARPLLMLIDYHAEESKDDLFYLMAALLFCLAFVRAIFPKYFRNLFVLFFQTSLRQKQTREQLLQDNLASLLINLLYVISLGLYMALLIQHRHWSNVSFWILSLVCSLALILVYLGKYLFLLFAGWVFNTREAAGAYTFIVFMINKVMGVALIPFLLVLSFSGPALVEVSITVSLVLIGGLFIYRYLLSFAALRNKLKVNALHFFLYLCAVELLPLILIYKVLINYMAGSF